MACQSAHEHAVSVGAESIDDFRERSSVHLTRRHVDFDHVAVHRTQDVFALDLPPEQWRRQDDRTGRPGEQQLVAGPQRQVGPRLQISAIAKNAFDHSAPADLRFDFTQRSACGSRDLVSAGLEFSIEQIVRIGTDTDRQLGFQFDCFVLEADTHQAGRHQWYKQQHQDVATDIGYRVAGGDVALQLLQLIRRQSKLLQRTACRAHHR